MWINCADTKWAQILSMCSVNMLLFFINWISVFQFHFGHLARGSGWGLYNSKFDNFYNDRLQTVMKMRVWRMIMETKKANKGPGYGSALSLRIQRGVRRAELGLRSPISALCSPSAFDGYERLLAVFILIMFKGFCWLLNWKTQLSSAGFLQPASSGLAHPPVYSPKFNTVC